MSSTRYLQPGVCVRHHPDTERRCRLDGGVAGLLPGRACAGFRGLGSGFNFASDADDCLLARDIARREARLGEVVGDCWYGDGTLVERGVTTAEPRCIDPSRRLILVTYTCGVGCEACPEQASNCVFQSEVYPTGICMPPTREILGQSLPCHIENPRVLCAPGLACLLPLRNGASGIRDRERWGICMEVRSCNIVAAILRDGYICDNTLMPQ